MSLSERPWIKDALSVIPLLLTIFVLGISLDTNREAREAAQNAPTNQLLISYLTKYTVETHLGKDVIRDLLAYNRVHISTKSEVSILLILLVTLVDSMNKAGNDRAATLSGFISGITGPQLEEKNYQRDMYASDNKTFSSIDLARQNISNRNPSCNGR